MNFMRYSKIRKMDISNGEGVRVSIFVQGCTFHCKNCFNSETWDFTGGKEFTEETLEQLMELCNRDIIKGLSILGGEPMHPKNAETVLTIVKTFKQRFPNKDIWIWSGFQFETLIKNPTTKEILNNIDFLIDGQFKDELKNLNLKWAGSENQRWLDIPESLKQNKAVIAGDMLLK